MRGTMSTTQQNSSSNGSSLQIFAHGNPLSDMMDKSDDRRSTQFSVLSFNLLAPVYVRPLDKRTGGIQPFAAFEWVTDDEILDIASRGPRLLEDLQSSAADIILLQELQLERKGVSWQLPDWMEPITDIYNVYLPPQDELDTIAARNVRVLDADIAVTCTVLYRKDCWSLIDDESTTGVTNTCVSVLLQGIHSKSNASPIFIASVHLDATNEAKRVRVLSKCLERAKRALLNYNHETDQSLAPISMIIAGDMNTECDPGSCVAAFLDNNETKIVSQANLQAQWALAHRMASPDNIPNDEEMKQWVLLHMETQQITYNACVSLDRIPTGATRAAYDHDVALENNDAAPEMAAWKLDHIFYTPQTLQPVAYWETLEADKESQVIGLPNHRIASDHLPLGAVFRVRADSSRLTTTEIQVLHKRLKQLSSQQTTAVAKLEARFTQEMARLQVLHAPVVEEHEPVDKKKKKAKKPKPPPEVQACMREKRAALRDVRTQHEQERRDFVSTLTMLERLCLEQAVGQSAVDWIANARG